MGLGAALCEPGHAVGDPPALPRTRPAGAGARRVVGGVRSRARPRPGGRRPARRRRRLALGVLVQPAARASCCWSPCWPPFPRAAIRSPAASTSPGVVLGVGGIGAAIYAAISGEYRGFGTWWIVALFVVGRPVPDRVRRASSCGCRCPCSTCAWCADRSSARHCSRRSPSTSACSRSSSSPRSTSTSARPTPGGSSPACSRRWRSPSPPAASAPARGWRAPAPAYRASPAACVGAAGMVLARVELGEGKAPVLRAARPRPRRRRPRVRHHGRAADLGRADAHPGRALGHGRLGHQHRAPARRGGRGGGARRDHQRAPDSRR